MSEFQQEAGSFEQLARQYLDALLRTDRHAASRMILADVEAGASVKDIYLNVFQPAQREIGRLWQTGRVTVAQEHYCSAATQLIMSQLYPYIFTGRRDKGRRLVACCVGGELHEIGLRMVADLLEMAGWDTYYLGANTPAATVLETLAQREADVLALSATIHFNIGALTELIDALRKSCRRHDGQDRGRWSSIQPRARAVAESRGRWIRRRCCGCDFHVRSFDRVRTRSFR